MKRKSKDKKMIIFGAVILVFLLSFFFDNKIISLMHLVKSLALDYAADWFSNVASIMIVLLIITSLFLWEEKKQKWIKPLWVSFALTAITSIFLKLVITRPRPAGEAFFMFTKVADYSFPSIHTALAFSVLPVLDKEYPKLKWFWASFAVFVGLSRLYLGMHYLSDVIGGAVIGYLIGWLVVSRKS